MSKEPLKELSYDTKLKLIQVAEDVLDRDGTGNGSFHLIEMVCPGHSNTHEWKSLSDVNYLLSIGYRLTTNSTVRHCALGAIETAAVEQGELPMSRVDYLDSMIGYDNINSLMGWSQDDSSEVWHVNDRGAGTNSYAALKVAEAVVRRGSDGG